MELVLTILPWVQIVLSVLLIAVVLLQQNEAGLGAGFGGSSGESFQRTRRGAEKVLLNATIILGILFALTSLAALFLRS